MHRGSRELVLNIGFETSPEVPGTGFETWFQNQLQGTSPEVQGSGFDIRFRSVETSCGEPPKVPGNWF